MAPSPDDLERRADESCDGAGDDGFRVSLRVFDGPFDLLLTLLSKHELDITEVVAEQGDGRVHRVPAASSIPTRSWSRPPNSSWSPRPCST